MALFATLERDTPEPAKLITLAHLASDFQDRKKSSPEKQVNVLLYGYLTVAAASDNVKQEIERNLMNRSLSGISKALVQMGVPIDQLYLGEMVFSGTKSRKIDLFLEQQGESRHYFPSNPPGNGRPLPTVNPPKPIRDSEININSNKQLAWEVTAKTFKSGLETVVPEISFKSTTGISPVDISNAFSAELTVWKPKIEGILRRLGQEGLAEKITFDVKLTMGGGLTKEFANQISVEIAAQLQAALTFNITIPGTSYELPVELSYSYGPGYRADLTDPTSGNVKWEGQGMIKVTVFRFKSL
ncbi:MAG: hypothetical protein ABI878_02785 [Acidobacteriota bacterium]